MVTEAAQDPGGHIGIILVLAQHDICLRLDLALEGFPRHNESMKPYKVFIFLGKPLGHNI